MIQFWRTVDEYGFLSNFSHHPVEINGKRWPTTEHYYQAMKSLDEDVQEKIRKQKSPKKSKTLACSIELREDWEEVKFDFMLEALRAKAEQYDFIRETLIETENEPLAENSPYDYIWGTGADGSGQNLLGKAWMQVREELIENA